MLDRSQLDLNEPWTSPTWIELTRVLLDSYERLLKQPLLADRTTPEEDARRLFDAPFVVVAHGREADPILCYGNRTALTLWETSLADLLQMPSRLTAEAVHRDERAQMLARTEAHGFIDDYRGIRISRTGQRFLIEQAIIWNLTGSRGEPVGQAATFNAWTPLAPLE